MQIPSAIRCPFCREIVAYGKLVCQGQSCGATVIHGLSPRERALAPKVVLILTVLILIPIQMLLPQSRPTFTSVAWAVVMAMTIASAITFAGVTLLEKRANQCAPRFQRGDELLRSEWVSTSLEIDEQADVHPLPESRKDQVVIEKTAIVQKLKAFQSGLKDYLALYEGSLDQTFPDFAIRNTAEIDAQRQDLMAKFYALSPVLRRFAEVQRFELYGHQYDIFQEALGDSPAMVKSFAIDQAILQVTGVIALIESMSEAEWTEQYHLTRADVRRGTETEVPDSSAAEIIGGATVLIRVATESKQQGSGFLIANSNLIVTCAHVVKDADRVSVQFMSEEGSTQARVIHRFQNKDLAILMLCKPFLGPSGLLLTGSRDWKETQSVLVAGYPDPGKFGHQMTISRAHISKARAKYKDSDDLIQISGCAADHGMSGGPLVLEPDTLVIGVLTEKALKTESVNFVFAIPLTEADVLEAIGENSRHKCGESG